MAAKIRSTIVLFALLCIVSAGVAQAQQDQQAQQPAPKPVIDQRALDILKKMSDTLTQAQSVSFNAFSMIPIKGPNESWINLTQTARVVKQGAGKLYVETRGDTSFSDYYYDGKTVTRYAPADNVYAVKDAPGNIDALIDQAYKEDGNSFPYADLLVASPYDILTDELIDALYVGQSTIKGVKTDHLALINEDVEWQIWIGTDDHMPRIIISTFTEDVCEPSSTTEFSDWKLNEAVPENTFVFNNTSNAAKIEFQNPKEEKVQ